MFRIRLALATEKAQLDALIARSGIGLSEGFYSAEQAAAVTREVFGVDSALVDDGSYFAIEDEGGVVVACGGWSRRATDFGGDRHKSGEDPHAAARLVDDKEGKDRLLDPATEPARIRAFFVEPAMARRGLGAMLLAHCTQAAAAAGFKALELVSTMPGEPLYLAHGFRAIEPIALPLSGGVVIALTRMRKEL